MSVLSLLGDTLRKPDGSTVNASEAIANKEVLALYFSAHWCPPCRGFTPQLSERYTALVAAGKDLEMVFVSSDKDDKAYNEYHSSMSFLGMPFARRDEKEALSKLFKVRGIPTLVFYDLKAGKVITTEGRGEIADEDFVANFPYRPLEFSMALLGETLRKPGGEEVKAADALQTDVIGLYFSAHWCPPCRGFTPVLARKYTELKAAGKSLEMLFVSSDKDDKAFNEYHDSMSFLALPFKDRAAKEKLSKVFKVQGIPSLVFLDAKTGAVINENGREGISADSFIEDFPFHPKPVNDLSASVDGINDEVVLLVLMEATEVKLQKAATAALNEVAAEEKKKPEAEQIATRFFTGCGGGPVDRVRQLCGYPALGEQDLGTATPLMLIMNFDDTGAHYHPPDDLKAATKANMQAFLKAFKAGTLTKRTPAR